MKKIIIFIFLLFGFFSITKADYLDLYGTGYNLRLSASTSFDYTESFTGKYMYIKTIECSNGNLSYLTGSLFKLNLYLNGIIKNHLYITIPGSYTLNVNSFVFNNYRITTSVLGSEYISSIGCNVNGILLDTLPILESNGGSSMTGITVYTDSTTLNLFENNDSLLEFYIFEAAIIFLIIIVAILFRLFKF